jgi:hypothetical protein
VLPTTTKRKRSNRISISELIIPLDRTSTVTQSQKRKGMPISGLTRRDDDVSIAAPVSSLNLEVKDSAVAQQALAGPEYDCNERYDDTFDFASAPEFHEGSIITTINENEDTDSDYEGSVVSPEKLTRHSFQNVVQSDDQQVTARDMPEYPEDINDELREEMIDAISTQVTLYPAVKPDKVTKKPYSTTRSKENISANVEAEHAMEEAEAVQVTRTSFLHSIPLPKPFRPPADLIHVAAFAKLHLVPFLLALCDNVNMMDINGEKW